MILSSKSKTKSDVDTTGVQKRIFGRKALIHTVSYSALIFFFALFQNCGGPPNALPGTGSSSSTLLSSAILNSVPFAYEISFNRIAHLGCTDGTYGGVIRPLDPTRFYTFAVNANNHDPSPVALPTVPAGLGLSPEFLSFADLHFRDQTGLISTDKVKEALTSSPANLDAKIQLALRPKSDFISKIIMPIPSSGSATSDPGNPGFNYDYIPNFLLSDTYIMADLWNGVWAVPHQPLDSFSGPTAQGSRSVDGYLRMPTVSPLALYNQMNGTSYLTVTFNDPTVPDEFLKKFASRVVPGSTTNSQANVWGKGYDLKFGIVNSVLSLNGVTELDLSADGTSTVNGSVITSPAKEITSTWSALKYTLYSAKERAQCGADTCAAATGLVKAECLLVSSYLSNAEWDINTTKKCLSPKVGAPAIAVTSAAECYPDVAADATNKITVDYLNTKTNCGTAGSFCVKPANLSILIKTN